jgi:hypothetical protein
VVARPASQSRASAGAGDSGLNLACAAARSLLRPARTAEPGNIDVLRVARQTRHGLKLTDSRRRNMSAQFWYLLALIPVIAIAYIIWSYRKRAGDRESARRERYVSLIGAQHGAGTPAAVGRKEQAALPSAATPGASIAQPALLQPAARRERFLTQPETVLYYVLKTGLPDHEIFPRVSLAAVMQSTENPPTHASSDAWSARQVLSFTICDKGMHVIAVVQLDAQASRHEMGAVDQRLSAAGVRLVQVSPAALPRREQVRSLILGLAT